MKKLLILDGNSVVNRAFYGIRLLTNAQGEYTNAVFGFMKILQKELSEVEPDYVCVAFDLKAPTFRHLQYEGYKKSRKGMPEELASQMPILREALDALRIPRIELETYEADDLIGTVSAMCRREGVECYIVTGDRDSLQLVGDGVFVRLVSTKAGKSDTKVYDAEGVREDFGVIPDRLPDLKGLMGDSSDEIPGVPGIGEKTARSLLEGREGLDELYASLDELPIRDTVKKKLTDGRESAFMSRTLATICKDAPIEKALSDFARLPMDEAAVYPLFMRLGFKSLLSTMGVDAPSQTDSPERADEPRESPSSASLSDIAAGERLYARLSGETLGVLCGAGMIESPAEPESLKRIFAGENPVAVHDLKATAAALRPFDISPTAVSFDALLAAYVLDPASSDYSLNALSFRYLGREPLEGLAEDCLALRGLCEDMLPKIEENGQHRLLLEVEQPLALVLADMERLGFLVDRQGIEDFGAGITGEIDGLAEEIHTLAGEDFNINSTKQLGQILFDKLNLPTLRKGKTGYSTDVDVLNKLRKYSPIIAPILKYRQLTKLKSTYVDGLLKVISPETGRIHSTFRQTVAQTGRISSTEPNLQNIPVREELGRELRRMFVAREGCVLVDADYSQIELRILAHMAGDETMLRAFREGIDIHTLTASEVFGVPPEFVLPEMRRRAKAVNFGIVYGIGEFSLSEDIGVSIAEAKRYIQGYFATYPGIKKYLDEAVEKAKELGYVETLLHRRRYLPELTSKNHNLRAFGQRAAMNAPIQGTAADVIKIAMVRVHRRLCAEGLESKLILQVHDELLVESPQGEAPAVSKLLKEEMEGAMELSLPLSVEVHTGKSWFDAK